MRRRARRFGWAECLLGTAGLLGGLGAPAAAAEEADWQALRMQAQALHQEGRLGDAIATAKQAVAAAEAAFGPDHVQVAIALNELGNLHRGLAKAALEEYLRQAATYERALAIWKTAFEPTHPNVGVALNNLAEVYQAQGEFAKAEQAYQAAAVFEASLETEHPVMVAAATNLLDVRQKLAEAAIPRGPGSDLSEDLDSAVDELAMEQGTDAEVEAQYQRKLQSLEEVLGADHPNVATWLVRMGQFYEWTQRLASAEAAYQRALRILEQASDAADAPPVS